MTATPEVRPYTIHLASGRSGDTTGLSRYASSLHNELVQIGVDVQISETRGPGATHRLQPLLNYAKLDSQAFFETYPLSVDRPHSPAILHLTSQNQSSAISFGHVDKIVVTVHDLITHVCRHDPEIVNYMKPYAKLMDRLSIRGLRRASVILADSEHTRNDVIRTLGFDPQRVIVAHLGIDHDRFQPKEIPRQFFQKYGLSKHARHVVYVGSEDPRKNLFRLVDAFRRVLSEFPDARMLKVGAARFDRQRQLLKRHLNEIGLASKVDFVDQVPESDLPYFYSLADAFVFPSLYEGFGLPVIEAMSSGAPVITSHSTSLGEISADAALLVDPRDTGQITDAIMQVLKDSDLNQSLRRRGRNHAASFTWNNTVTKTIEAYELAWG